MYKKICRYFTQLHFLSPSPSISLSLSISISLTPTLSVRVRSANEAYLMRADTKPRVKFNRRLISDRLGLSHSHRHHHTGSNVVRLDTSLGARRWRSRWRRRQRQRRQRCCWPTGVGSPWSKRARFGFGFHILRFTDVLTGGGCRILGSPWPDLQPLPAAKLIPIPQTLQHRTPHPLLHTLSHHPWSCADEFLQANRQRLRQRQRQQPRPAWRHSDSKCHVKHIN